MIGPIQQIVINTGEFYFSSGKVRISTLLGSCVAFTAWHPTRHIGGMCHYLLPNGTPGVPKDAYIEGTFAEEAAALFETAFRASGTRASEYVVKMFGGGSMFPQHSSGRACSAACDPSEVPNRCLDVPCRNVVQGKRLFESRGLVVTAADVGGTGPRRVMLDLWSGDVWVRKLGPPNDLAL
jgi:chemotaxis protein CheD